MIEPYGTVSDRTQHPPRRERRMPILAFIGRVLVVGIGGGGLGLLLAALATGPGTGIGTSAVGPWIFRPQIGTTEIDPYARASLARSGALPLGAAEGLSFFARGDSSGNLFDPACDYRVTGNVPRARNWTLTLYADDGALVANAANRHGFTSAEILRSAGGGFEIVVSRHARPGNWLPAGDDARFVLVLRLYDTELDTSSKPLDATAMPRIEKLNCR
jgi:hypothetical protein